MIDRKNTIENLEQNIRWIEEIECHQFPGWVNVTMAMRDAAELLKEQEPVKVADGRPRCRFECGNCGTEFAFVYNYCPSCGRKVKWDADD